MAGRMARRRASLHRRRPQRNSKSQKCLIRGICRDSISQQGRSNPMMTGHGQLSDATLANVPHRRSRKSIVVLKFGGTTAGATREQARIRLARHTIANLIEQNRFVVPVFSAYRRGRSGSRSKFSVTDLLQNAMSFVRQQTSFADGIDELGRQLRAAHDQLIADLNLSDHATLTAEIHQDIETLKNTIAMACSAYEPVPSLNDLIMTAGERLVVRIMAGYLNAKHAAGRFPMKAAPVTALEMGLYTDSSFGGASIDWARAVEHSREVLVGQYLEQGIVPVVTGFDGIYDPNNEFREIMQSAVDEHVGERYSGVYRTSLGRGGSDLTATFLGLALNAEYVGFCKETPGVLTADDMLVGEAAQTVRELDYDLATEAGNIYSRAVEPVRAGGVPVHIFDPARPDERTVVRDVQLPAGLYIVERPMETVNIHCGTIPDEPGSLMPFLQIFAKAGVNLEEIRHQRSGTDCIVEGNEDAIQSVIAALNDQGLRPRAHFTWYLRVIGNVTEELAARFNEFMHAFEPLTLATYQLDTKVLTATVVRNRAGAQLDETQRIESIVQRVHDEFVVPTLQQPAVDAVEANAHAAP